MKTTLVIGASENPERYSFKAITQLRFHDIETLAFGLKTGKVADVDFDNEWNSSWKVETVTLYIGIEKQKDFYSKIIELQPKRVIFNPGTENELFYALLKENNIQVEIACTLVLLSLGNYSI